MNAPPPRRRHVRRGLIALSIGAILTGGVAWFVRPVPGPLDAVPATSLVVIDANTKALRESRLRERVEGALKARVPLDKLDQACGFATLARVDRAVVTIGEGEAGGVGVALDGRISEKELLNCETQLIIGAVGTTKNQLEKSYAHGSFLLTPLRLADVDIVLGVGLRRPLLVASPTWTEQLADAADRPQNRSFLRLFEVKPMLPAPHDAVRARLEKATAGLPLLLAASVKRVPRDPLPLIAGFLPTQELAARAAEARGLGAIGAALSETTQGDQHRAVVHGILELADDNAAKALADVLLGVRLHFAQNLMVRAVGLGPLLDSLKVSQDGAWVSVRFEDDSAALADHLDQARVLLSGEVPR